MGEVPASDRQTDSRLRLRSPHAGPLDLDPSISFSRSSSMPRHMESIEARSSSLIFPKQDFMIFGISSCIMPMNSEQFPIIFGIISCIIPIMSSGDMPSIISIGFAEGSFRDLFLTGARFLPFLDANTLPPSGSRAGMSISVRAAQYVSHNLGR